MRVNKQNWKLNILVNTFNFSVGVTKTVVYRTIDLGDQGN